MITLSEREVTIIQKLMQGCDNGEIAKDLHIAERTVKAHFNRMFIKFGIKNGIKRVKLAVLAYRLGIENEDAKKGGSYDERQVDRLRINPSGRCAAGDRRGPCQPHDASAGGIRCVGR
jgi:DNA-binding CsgD family transcriptional regulator